MSNLRTAAQQALAFTMRDFASLRDFEAAKAVLHDNLRAALAQQAEPVEPVAWECKAGGLKPLTQRQYDAQTAATKRHYTRIAPPQRKPLTEEEISAIDWKAGETLHDFARAIERAHGIGGEA